MSCILILANVCVLYKLYVHNKIEVVCMVVLVVGSESSQNWVRVVSGLGPIRLGSEKYQGSELSWVRVVRLPYRMAMLSRPSVVVRPSVVRRPSTISKIFSSETAWPIKTKLHVEPPKEGGT